MTEGKLKIVHVEDDNSIGTLFKSMIEKRALARDLEVEVDTFKSGDAALDGFSPGQYSAGVFDQDILGMRNGIETAIEMNRIDPNMRLYFLSSHVGTNSTYDAKIAELGGTGFSKPQQMIDTMSKVLEDLRA